MLWVWEKEQGSGMDGDLVQGLFSRRPSAWSWRGRIYLVEFVRADHQQQENKSPAGGWHLWPMTLHIHDDIKNMLQLIKK